jgi:uncharacterized protein YcgL (UPF0745 family)
MESKKKFIVLIVCLTLNLAIMACHIPLVSQSIETQGVATEIPKATEIDETEVIITSTPTHEVTIGSDTKQVYYGDGIEITLPGFFIVGEADEIEAFLEEENLLNGEHAQGMEGMFENFKDDILLWGYDTNPTREKETGLFVMKNEQFGGMSLMLISAFIQPMIGSQIEIEEQQIITIGERDALRLLTSPGDLDVQGSQVIYIFNEDGKLWIIGFFTSTDLVQDRLQVFDDVVESLKIIEGE